MHEEWIVW
jgi:hypothetical protein